MDPDERTFEDFVNAQTAEDVAELEAHEAEKGGPGAWLDGDPNRWFAQAMGQMGELGIALCTKDPAAIKRHTAHARNLLLMARQTALQDVK